MPFWTCNSIITTKVHWNWREVKMDEHKNKNISHRCIFKLQYSSTAKETTKHSSDKCTEQSACDVYGSLIRGLLQERESSNILYKDNIPNWRVLLSMCSQIISAFIIAVSFKSQIVCFFQSPVCVSLRI